MTTGHTACATQYRLIRPWLILASLPRRPAPDDKQVPGGAGNVDEGRAGLAAYYHALNVQAGRDASPGDAERLVEPLPGRFLPGLPQMVRRAAPLGEIPARRNPGVHGHQLRSIAPCGMSPRTAVPGGSPPTRSHRR